MVSKTRKADIPEAILDAALDLAATKSWRHTSLADIAGAAGVSLAEIRAHYSSKPAIVAAITRRIDAAVLAGDQPELAGEPARDRLFDVMMRRFDAMAPNREAIRSILGAAPADPVAALSGACTLACSMAWMLEAARIGSSGFSGLLRIKGLALIYLPVLRVWLEDESDDMARTMAALDRRLGQADRLMTLCRFPRARQAPADPDPEPA